MEQHTIHNYLVEFFTLNKCQIESNQDGKLTVKLTEDLDRLLLNRPFYWEYMKKMGQEGTPATMTFLSSSSFKDEKGEWIHFGSPRLHQIFRYQLKEGKYSLVYEKTLKQALRPWLVVNVMIQFKGRLKRDELLSIGLNLINGAMVFEFMEKISGFSFSNMISDYCFTISPIIRIPSAYKRIENYLRQYIEEQDKEWAKDALQFYQQEKEIIDHFYQSYLEAASDEDKELIKMRFEKEQEDLKKRLIPEVNIQIINGGLFYLSERSSSTILEGIH
jgi:hypothetical protein